MPTPILSRIQNAWKAGWNTFQDQDPLNSFSSFGGPSSSTRPDRVRLNLGTAKSMATPLYNRIAIDVASIAIQHVRLDQNESYVETIDSGLNNCLTLAANIDQTGRSFIQDVVMSMFDEGAVAIVAVDTTTNPSISSGYDVKTMRTGKIVEWMPYHVRVNVYNERIGQKVDVVLAKRDVAIVENPLYAVMNEQNSTLKRLIHKLNLLDSIDEQSGSGKLDLIIQLPYVIKTEARKKQAEERRQDIEEQLQGGKHGIAYTDGTEKITQLNRPVENNLMTQIEYLTSMLYSQLGLSTSIFDGTATEGVMLSYHNRTVEPIIAAIADSMKRTFLTSTGRTQGQSIAYFKNPFGLVPVSQIGSLIDVLTRNAVTTSNEVRGIIGFKPHSDPTADTLSNKNLNPPTNQPPAGTSSNLDTTVNNAKGA